MLRLTGFWWMPLPLNQVRNVPCVRIVSQRQPGGLSYFTFLQAGPERWRSPFSALKPSIHCWPLWACLPISHSFSAFPALHPGVIILSRTHLEFFPAVSNQKGKAERGEFISKLAGKINIKWRKNSIALYNIWRSYKACKPNLLYHIENFLVCIFWTTG